MNRRFALPIIVTSAIILFVVIAGNTMVASGLGWYAMLEKPAWTPPAAIFTPIWMLIYLFVGYAGVRVWSQMKRDLLFIRVNVLFATSFFFYFAYIYFFFVSHKLGVSILSSIILAVTMVMTANALRHESKTASAALLLVAVWLVFASYLTYSVWQLNEVASFL